MRNITAVRSPWWQIGLTVLPGVMWVFLIWVELPDPLRQAASTLALAVVVILCVASVLPAILHHNVLDIPAWGLLASGYLVGLAATLGLATLTGTLDLYYTCYIALVVASLVFARRHGLAAGLFVLAGGILIAFDAIEPTLYIDSSPAARYVGIDCIFVLFWVLTPIAVLRARSVVGQLLGLLVPLALYAAAFVYVTSSISGLAQPYFKLSVSQSISAAQPIIYLFVAVVLAAPIHLGIFEGYFTPKKVIRGADLAQMSPP